MLGRSKPKAPPAPTTASVVPVLETVAAITERVKEFRARRSIITAEIVRLEKGGFRAAKVDTPLNTPRERGLKLLAGEAVSGPPVAADPAVMLGHLYFERVSIDLAIEALNQRGHMAALKEGNDRYREREPGRNKIASRVSETIRDLLLLTLELRAYDTETGGMAVQTAPGSLWRELQTGSVDCFMPRWLLMAVKEKWIRRSDVASAFKAAGLSTFDLG
jgi:hypothetical protein